MFFRAVTTPLMTPVPNFNKWCAVSNFLFKNIDFCIFTPKTPLVKENYFLTLWNFTYLKDTSFGKTSCNFKDGLETKNEFEKWPLITFFQCISPMYFIRNMVIYEPLLKFEVKETVYSAGSKTGDTSFSSVSVMVIVASVAALYSPSLTLKFETHPAITEASP